MNITKIAILSLALTAFATAASAKYEGSDWPPPEDGKVYLGLGVAYTELTDASVDAEAGVTAVFGTRMSERASVELNGTYNGEFGNLSVYGVGSTIKFHAPFGRLDPFIGGGIGYIGADADGLEDPVHGFEAHVTAGVNVWITDNLALRIDGTYTEALAGDDGAERLDHIGGGASLVVRF